MATIKKRLADLAAVLAPKPGRRLIVCTCAIGEACNCAEQIEQARAAGLETTIFRVVFDDLPLPEE